MKLTHHLFNWPMFRRLVGRLFILLNYKYCGHNLREQ